MNIFKDPVTDHGKLSKKGRLTLELDESGQFVTRTEGTGDPEKVSNGSLECITITTIIATFSPQDQLVTVFENGELVKEHTFEEVRARADLILN